VCVDATEPTELPHESSRASGLWDNSRPVRLDAAAAVATARDYIRDHGGATKQDLVKNVMPDHPLGYDVDAALDKIDAGDRYRGAWWRRIVKPGLKALDDVQTPPQGASTWRYAGEAPVDT